MAHSHKPKIVDWKFDAEHNFVPSLYGCTECDATFRKLPKEKVEKKHSHKTYVDGCLACKLPTLQLNTGDAGRANSMPQKKWDKELGKYEDARKQGIQPAGTSTEQIEAAVKASENLGRAYNAEVMPPAKTITKTKAKNMNELKKAGLE